MKKFDASSKTQMTGYTESAFVKKLAELNNSSQSIQTLSLWLIHHRKHHGQIVKTWQRELVRAKENKKLTFMYLANDVIQNSRKKGPEFGKEFGTMLPKAFQHLSSMNYDEKMKTSLGRLLNIWGERGIYDEILITEFRQALLFPPDKPKKKKSKEEGGVPEKKQKTNSTKERKKSDTEVTVEVDGTVETRVHLSPHTPATDTPEPDELIKVLQDLDNNLASADEIVRQKIAQLPRSVSEVSLLTNIEDKQSAENLSSQVNDAVKLIEDYNNRLANEVDLRKKSVTMLHDFLLVQRELLTQAETTLEMYQDKLQKVYSVHHELKTHIRNLPDLTRLPDVTHGLSPLPSAGDLFRIHQ